MAERSINDQIAKYLADAHSIEEQAIQQMEKAPSMAKDRTLAGRFSAHLDETREQKRLVDERLEKLGESPSKFKDLIMRAGGEGFVLFAKSQPDTPGKLLSHAYSYEALEEASYELMRRVAERAGDQETVAMAERIRAQETAMKERLAESWDIGVDMSLQDKGTEDIRADLVKYLEDAHALEAQAEQMLEAAPKIVGDHPTIEQVFRAHLGETREHKRLVEERLAALGGSPSRLKDAAMRLGAINWGGFFKGHPDTTGKLVAFAYAFEHLEIGGYEQLARTARRAGDEGTARMAEQILAQERGAAQMLERCFDAAAEAALAEAGAT
jgi:ferritin-like metal-binding protein YciE